MGLERLELAEKSNQLDVALMVSVMANYDNIYRIRADFSRTLNEGGCPMRMMKTRVWR